MDNFAYVIDHRDYAVYFSAGRTLWLFWKRLQRLLTYSVDRTAILLNSTIKSWIVLIAFSLENRYFGSWFWILCFISPSIISTLTCATFLWQYANVNMMLALPVSIIFGLLVNVLVVISKFLRSTFLLATGESLGKVIRIWIVSVLLLLSPFSSIQENVGHFINSYSCSANLTYAAGTNASSQLGRAAISITKNATKCINDLSAKLENVVAPPIDGITDVLKEVESIFNFVYKVEDECRNGMTAVKEECDKQKKAVAACELVNLSQSKTARFLFGPSCTATLVVSASCHLIDTLNVCDLFSKVAEVKHHVAWLRGEVGSIKNEVSFKVDFVYDSSTISNNTSLTPIKEGFEVKFMQLIDIILFTKSCYGILYLCTFTAIIYRKAKLTRNVLKGKKVNYKFSEWLIWINPFVFNIFLIALIGLVDFASREFYLANQKYLKDNPIQFGTNYSAGFVPGTNGFLSRFLASQLSSLVDVADNFGFKIELEKCFSEPLSAPAYFRYIISVIVSVVGWKTFQIDREFLDEQNDIVNVSFGRFDGLINEDFIF